MKALLEKLSALNIKLSLVDGQLKVNAPKGAITAEIRQQMVANKAALIALLENLAQKNNSDLPLVAVSPEEAVTASFAQQRLWFVDQFDAAKSAYNINVSLKLSGVLQLNIVERCLNDIVARHEILRTGFSQQDGELLLVSEKDVSVAIETFDCIDGDELNALVEQQSLAPFALEQPPLLRASLFSLSEQEHVMLLVLHHIVADGWSMGVLVKEFATLYKHYVTNGLAAHTEVLPALPVQYRDYARWQQQRMRQGELNRQLQFWQDYLADLPPLLELPCDKPRPVNQQFNGALYQFEIPKQLLSDIEALAKQHDMSLFMILMSGYQLLLSRYCNSEDIAVGTPVANRNRNALEPLVGMFVNTLVLRNDLKGTQRFTELLAQVKKNSLKAFDCQDLPFDQVVDALTPERSSSYSPLFQVMMVLQNIHIEPLSIEGLNISPYELQNSKAKFDLTLSFEQSEQGQAASWEYCTDLFEPSTIARMSRHFVNLLSRAVAAPDTPLAHLDMLEAAEKAQFTAGRVADMQSFEQRLTIAQRFEQMAAQHPQNTALSMDGNRLNYRALSTSANRIASELIAMGVTPGTRVGLHLERSMELIVAMLAIVKSGGTYVPLDPNNPQDRLQYIVQDAGLKVVLTDRDLGEAFTGVAAVMVTPDCLLEQELSSAPQVAHNVDLPAYVIYTSGSTGQPKGVNVSHANVGRLFDSTQRDFQFNAEDVWTFFHSSAFDFSVWEIWGALLHGGCVEIVPYLVSRDTQAFYQLVAQKGVTVLNQTPSAFAQFIAQHQQQKLDLSKLRYVVFGGEALDLQTLRPWFEQQGDSQPQLVNMYGITETTVHVTYRPISKADLNGNASVIGRPLSDLAILILDGNMQPVPQGVSGEIYVAGAGLSLGYLNRESLTKERFVDNPYAATMPGAPKLYKTGDVGRFLADGEVEYLGRNDHQVKIRGFRIELGEIEARISESALANQALVLVKTINDAQRLVAYVVPATDVADFDAKALSAAIAEHLPEHMIPTYFVAMESFPLTINGKINRSALPLPDSTATIGGEYEPPKGALEQALVDIWQKVLQQEKVGVNDNYFSLGGDSIQVIKVMSELKQYGRQMTVAQLFQNPTIRSLAHAINQTAEVTEATEALTPFGLISEQDKAQMPQGVEDAYPVSGLQGGIIYHGVADSSNALYHNVTSHLLRFPYDVEKFRQALTQLIARHSILRTAFDYQSFSEPLQLVYQEVPLPLAVEDISELDKAEQQKVIDQCFADLAKQPMALDKAPLLKVIFHRLGQDQVQFTLVEHHAILDGWSVQSMCNELLENYAQLLSGDNPQRSPLTSSYRDFVAAEQQAVNSSEVRGFWQDYLADFEPLKLPMRSDNEVNPDYVRYAQVGIDQNRIGQIEALAQKLKVSVKAVFLAAHCKVLSFLSGQNNVTAGLTGHGRVEAVDGDKVLGMFATSIPLRLSLDDLSWADLIKRIYAVENQLTPHSRFPAVEQQALVGGQSLSDTQFTFTDFGKAGDAHKTSGIEFETTHQQTENNFVFDVTLERDISNDRLGLHVDVDDSLLLAEGAKTAADYFERCLKAIIANAQQSHGELSLMTQAEIDACLAKTHPKRAVLAPNAKTVVAQFEQLAKDSPQLIAVQAGSEQLSYGQLNAQANRLAHYLRERSVKTGDLVGVMVERSPQMLVSILAVLKAGGAYVPLDPAYPSSRLQHMIDDSGVAQLIVHEALLEKVDLAAAIDVTVIDSESTQTQLQNYTDEDLLNARDDMADSPAYVIYTSGSTGLPKGVVVSHQNLSAYCRSAQQHYQVDHSDNVLQFSSLSFDIFVEEMFVTLSAGAALVLRDDALLAGAQRFWQFVERFDISVCSLPTAYWHALCSSLDDDTSVSEHLRLMIVGGEAMSGQMLKLWQVHMTDKVQLLNTYGPTEGTVIATVFDATGFDAAIGAPPIGKPVSHSRCYVLDEQGHMCPVGVRGRLYLGGESVACGYLNQPELSAKRFVIDPYSDRKGARMYNTGDVAAFDADGNLHFFGRVDEQVKIRGFRIELGEIEQRLSEYAEVEQAVVIAKAQSDGDNQLLAYITVNTADAAPVDSARLRSQLQVDLPYYMVPEHLVVMAEMPLTDNGKINKKALPEPQLSQQRCIAAKNDTEAKLLVIWQQLLQQQQISTDANFFSLGGHSLLAMRLLSAIEKQFQVRLDVVSVFSAPTIALLAEKIEQCEAGQSDDIPQVDRDGPLPLSFAQQRLWMIDHIEGSRQYHMPGALKITGEVDYQRVNQAVGAIIERHEILRTCYRETDEGVVQVIKPFEPVEVPLHDLSHLQGEAQQQKVAQLSAEEADKPFDLSGDNVLRVSLLKLSSQCHICLITMHHIGSDGWSMAILTRDFMQFYDGFCRGEADVLTPLQVQYADFAHWQRQRLSGDNYQKAMSYWVDYLQGAPQLHSLPFDRPRPSEVDVSAAVVQTRVSEDVSNRLDQFCLAHNVTLSMLLQNAFAVLLSRWSEQQDIIIGSPVVGRPNKALEPLIGCFLNTLAFRFNTAGEQRFIDYLGQGKDRALAHYDHQEVPFDMIVNELKLPRSKAYNPLVQIWFVMQNNEEQAMSLSGLQFEEIDSGEVTAQFDLQLSAAPQTQGLFLTWSFPRQLFDEATIEHLAQGFNQMLAAIVENPNQSLAQLPMPDMASLKQQQQTKTRDKLQSKKFKFKRKNKVSGD